MKKIEFELFPNVKKLAYPEHLIKTREELLKILLETIRNSMVADSLGDNHGKEKFVFYVDKMQRVFYFIDRKYFSIAIPFSVQIEQSKIRFFYDKQEVTSQAISNIVQLFDTLYNKSTNMTTICDLLLDENLQNVWPVMISLMTYELGYVRYDVDPDNYEKAVKKGTPLQHSLNHMDCCYSSAATFKVGLQDALSPNQLIEIMDNTRDRWVLHTPNLNHEKKAR